MNSCIQFSCVYVCKSKSPVLIYKFKNINLGNINLNKCKRPISDNGKWQIFPFLAYSSPSARKRANSRVMKRVNLCKLLITNKVKSIFRRNRKMGIQLEKSLKSPIFAQKSPKMSPGKRPKKSRKSPIWGKFIMLNASWLLSGNRRQRRPKTETSSCRDKTLSRSSPTLPHFALQHQ